MADSDFRFPVEGKQSCWEYVYTFDNLAPEDISILDQLVATNKEWKKVNNGYKFTHIDKKWTLSADALFDLKNKQLIFIHGTVVEE